MFLFPENAASDKMKALAEHFDAAGDRAGGVCKVSQLLRRRLVETKEAPDALAAERIASGRSKIQTSTTRSGTAWSCMAW
jgi:hypothetical protein